MSTYHPLLSEVPNAFAIAQERGRSVITVPLAATEDGHRQVALQVWLAPAAWRGVELHEFKFAIVAVDENDEPAIIYDRFAAVGYLETVRPLVMPSVLAAARHLFDTVRPACIHRVTFTTHPDEKASAKHQMVTSELEAAGYAIVSGGYDRYGRRYWLMMRNGSDDA